MILNRAQILAAQDVRTETVDVPDWGGSVLVKVMTGAEREALEQQWRDRARLGQLGQHQRALLVVATVVDEAGAPLFTPADVESLSQRSAVALDVVASVALRLNRMRDSDIEEAAKN